MARTTIRVAISAFAGMTMWSGMAAATERPSMKWGEATQCFRDDEGGFIHAQCDADRKKCFFHDGCMARKKGEPCKALERMQSCVRNDSETAADLAKKGTVFQPAIAAAPPGWKRDAHGRVFQTEFDMNRRVWFGGRYEPTLAQHRDGMFGRAVIETGVRVETLSSDTRHRYRFHVMNGELGLNPLGVRATALRFDASSESDTPLLRFTTFWPEAQRHDLYLNIGGWVEVMTVDYRVRQRARELHMRFVAAGPTLDLWHSRDMMSYVRLRAGGAFDDLRQNGDEGHDWLAVTPLGGVEADITFDRAGMHRLALSTQYELPIAWRDGKDAPPTPTHRFLNSIAYEPILMAVNDQPVSLRLSATGGYRSDLPEPHRGWELQAGVGLRVNFWVPAPSADDRQRIIDMRGE